MKANKRILCIILALLMCLSTAVISVSADILPSDKVYKELIFDSLGDRVNEHYSYNCEYVYNGDGSEVGKFETPDFALVRITSCVAYDAVVDLVIGDYYFYQSHMYEPFALGYCIYSFEEHKCYSLSDAWNAQLPQTEKILAMLGKPVDKTAHKYKDIVLEAFGDMITTEYQEYRYIYSYNADGSTPDEGEMPDYIVGWISSGGFACAIVERVIGDYYFRSANIYYPYDLGYFICSTKENKCYSLDEAWEAKLPNVEMAFSKAGTHVDEADYPLAKYRTKVISKLGWENIDEEIQYRCVAEYTENEIVEDGATPDYAVVFAHKGAWTEELVYSIIGNYRLKASNDFKPGYIIYSINEDKIYTMREAYNQKLPGIEFALEKAGTKVTWYADVFEEFLEPYKEDGWGDFEQGWYGYDELYYYSYQKRYGSTEMFEVTPDYVLIKGSTYFADPMLSYDVFGDYIVYGGCGFPNCSNYYIYTPKDGKLYTLREACDAGVKELDKVFTNYGLGVLKGDADSDRKLTIKDATYIQKYLAKIEGFELNEEIRGHHLSVEDDGSPDPYGCYIEDFDNNDRVNIKDATAIQKKLAKY